MTVRAKPLPPALQRLLLAELAPGERVLYAGQPDWRAEWGKLLVTFMFGAGWTAICGFMAIVVWTEALGISLATPSAVPGRGMGQGFALFFGIMLVPFVLIGLACLAAPFLSVADAKRRVHAVTGTRILSLTAGRRRSVDSCKLSSVNFIKRYDRGDGSGSLEIGYGVETDGEGSPRPLTQSWPGIPDVKRAEAVIREHAKWTR